MKAKEYAKRLKESIDKNAELGKIMHDFFIELKDLIKVRNISTDEGTVPIIREFDQKFKAFVGISNAQEDEFKIKPEGFMLILKKEMPEVYKFYDSQKA